MSKPLMVSFALPKDGIRKLPFSDPAHVVYHVYPRLSDYRGRSIPDKNNPRPKDDPFVLTTGVSKKIRETLESSPKSFRNRNRGGLVIAHAAHYDDAKQQFSIVLTDYEEHEDAEGNIIRPMHGLADGSTTDYTIAAVQDDEKFKAGLADAQFHLEVVVFADGINQDDLRAYILDVCEARNTSKQVTPWAIADLRGDWNWLRQQIEPRWPGKVAYQEFERCPTTVLDVIAILNLFHPDYSGNRVPTNSYSSKGSMFKRYETREAGFKLLGPVVSNILELHDLIFSTFNSTSKAAGRRLRTYVDTIQGTKLFREFDPPIQMIFGSYSAELDVDRGLLYPMLSAFRALLDFNGTTRWFTDPKKFWEKHGPTLMEQLMDALDGHRKSPEATGKDPNVYRYLYQTVHSIRRDEELERLLNRK